MALSPSGIDAQLEQFASLVRRRVGDALNVKTLTATALSDLSQVPTTFQDLFEAVGIFVRRRIYSAE